jgi:hypothetical protein
MKIQTAVVKGEQTNRTEGRTPAMKQVEAGGTSDKLKGPRRTRLANIVEHVLGKGRGEVRRVVIGISELKRMSAESAGTTAEMPDEGVKGAYAALHTIDERVIGASRAVINSPVGSSRSTGVGIRVLPKDGILIVSQAASIPVKKFNMIIIHVVIGASR